MLSLDNLYSVAISRTGYCSRLMNLLLAVTATEGHFDVGAVRPSVDNSVLQPSYSVFQDAQKCTKF